MLELRGEAPGVKEGGAVEQLIHEVQFECEAKAIPEKLSVNINQLKLGDSITVADLEIPPGAIILADVDAIVVQCVEPAAAPEEEEVAASMEAEPEVIGRKEEEEEKKGD